jgi:membrane-associated phospholipid phosphatase
MMDEFLKPMRGMRFISVGIMLLLAGSYYFIDRPMALWSHSHCVGDMNALFYAITQLGDSKWYLVPFGIGFLFFRYVRPVPQRMYQQGFWFATVAVSGIVADIIKVIAGRFRPEKWFHEGLYGFDFFHLSSAMTGFPSGHTTTAFALAMALSKFYPKYALIGWGIALAVGVSRVMVGMHYVSDVIAGAIVGVVSVQLLITYWPLRWSFK